MFQYLLITLGIGFRNDIDSLSYDLKIEFIYGSSRFEFFPSYNYDQIDYVQLDVIGSKVTFLWMDLDLNIIHEEEWITDEVRYSGQATLHVSDPAAQAKFGNIRMEPI